MICDNCKKFFMNGNTKGMPNGVAFVMNNGDKVTMCQRCLIELGKMSDDEKNTFFDELKKKIGRE